MRCKLVMRDFQQCHQNKWKMCYSLGDRLAELCRLLQRPSGRPGAWALPLRGGGGAALSSAHTRPLPAARAPLLKGGCLWFKVR